MVCLGLEVFPTIAAGDDDIGLMAIRNREELSLAILDVLDCGLLGNFPHAIGVAAHVRNGVVAILTRILVDALDLSALRHVTFLSLSPR